MLPLQFSVRAGDAATYLELTAWLLALTFFVALIAVLLYLRHAGIGTEERRQLATLVPQLFQTTAHQVTIHADESPASRRERFREALTRQIGDEVDPAEQTLLGASRELLADLRSVVPNWPQLAIRGVAEGVLILAFGAILFVSVQWWEQALELPSVGGAAVSLGTTLWQGVVAVLGLFPFPDSLAIVGLTAATLTGSLLVQYWALVGIVLIVAALAFAAIDRMTAEDLDVTLYPDRRVLIGYPIGGLLLVWIAGTLTRAAAELTRFADNATTVGFVVAILCASVLVGIAALSVRDRVISAQARPDENSLAVAGYILLRRALFVGVLLALPLVIYLGFQAIVSGQVGVVAGVFLAAPLLTQVLLAGAVIAVIAVVLSRTTGDIGLPEALGRAWRSATIRAWIFARGIPATAMILAFALAWAFVGTQPVGGSYISSLLGLWPPVVAAIIVGAFVRSWTLLWTRLRYRFMSFGESCGPQTIVIECFPELEDADGEPVYIARIQGQELAHRDVDHLLRDLETTIKATFEAEAVPATMSSYYWLDLRRGTVAFEDVIAELRGDVLSRIRVTLADNGGRVDADVIEDELRQDYPEEAIDQMLQVLYERSDVSYRDGDYYYHG